MRHRKGFNHLGRTSAHRKAMLSNMASSLILHKRITTTMAKAKALRSYIEPLITKSKNDTTHSRRVVFSHLKDKYAVAELFREVSPKVMERPGGYTRILKIGNRLGDNAEMCIIELVDYNENMLEDTTKKAKSTRRRRGSGKTKVTASAAETGKADKETDVEVEEETQVEEEVKAETEEKTQVEEEVKAEAEEKTQVEEEVKAEAEVKTQVEEEVKAEAEEKTQVEEEIKAEKETELDKEKQKNVNKEDDKKE